MQKAFEALSHSTHLFGRRLVLEWTAPDDGIVELRKRTAEQFHASAKRSKKGVFDHQIILMQAKSQKWPKKVTMKNKSHSLI